MHFELEAATGSRTARHLDLTRHGSRAATTTPAGAHEYELALAGSGIATWFWDGRTEEFRTSGNLEELVGACSGTYPSPLDAICDIVHTDDRDDVIREVARATAARRTFSITHRLAATNVHRLRSDDTPDVGAYARWACIEGRPLVEEGVFLGMCGTYRDVTDDRNAAAFRDETAERYELLIEHGPDAAVIHQDGILVYANERAAELIGADNPNQLLGSSILDYIHPDSVADILSRLAQMQDEPHAVAPYAEERFVRLDGDVIEGEACSTATVWKGQPAYQVVFRDISERKAAEAEISYQAELARQVSDAIVATDCDLRIESWNKAAAVIFGFDSGDAIGRPLHDVLPNPVFEDVTHVDDAFFTSGRALEAEHVLYRRDGEPVRVRMSVSPIHDTEGALIGTVSICSDVTRWRQTEQQYGAVVAALSEGILVIDPDGTISSANSAAAIMLSGRDNYIVGRSVFDFSSQIVDENHTPLPHAMHPVRLTARHGTAQDDVVVGIVDGDSATPESVVRRWLSVTARPLHSTDGSRLQSVVCSITDVTEATIAKARLSYQATRDPLTGLVNRTVLLEHIRDMIEFRYMKGLAVLFVDLDFFKMINDSLGHVAGDEVLQSIAERICDSAGASATVGRQSGDEFVVLLDGIETAAEADACAERIATAIAAPLRVGQREFNITASIGIVAVEAEAGDEPGDEGPTPAGLLRDADVAMYRAKERGRACVQRFDTSLRERALERIELQDSLFGAIERGELAVHYQPYVTSSDGAVVGVEALVRWNHPTLGRLAPGKFIPVAEDSHLIVSLGYWVLEQACNQVADWRRMNPDLASLRVSVNLAARQLADPGLVKTVAGVLELSGLEASALSLELTESVLMDDSELAIGTLNALRDLGVRISIDDFGTGYSSLAYLKRFAVDYLKIDKSFVAGLGNDAEDENIVRAVTGLAHSLGLEVVAEGVETEAQLQWLKALRVDIIQGYIFARPQAAADAASVLAALALR